MRRPRVYGVKFHFLSGSPGYVGGPFILQGDVLRGHPPFVLHRGRGKKLITLLWQRDCWVPELRFDLKQRVDFRLWFTLKAPTCARPRYKSDPDL